MEGRAHDRHTRSSVCRDWRFQFSGSVRLASADCERYFGRQHKAFPATPGLVPTEQANSLVTFSTMQCDALAVTATHTACMLVSASHRFIAACSNRNHG